MVVGGDRRKNFFYRAKTRGGKQDTLHKGVIMKERRRREGKATFAGVLGGRLRKGGDEDHTQIKSQRKFPCYQREEEENLKRSNEYFQRGGGGGLYPS